MPQFAEICVPGCYDKVLCGSRGQCINTSRRATGRSSYGAAADVNRIVAGEPHEESRPSLGNNHLNIVSFAYKWITNGLGRVVDRNSDTVLSVLKSVGGSVALTGGANLRLTILAAVGYHR